MAGNVSRGANSDNSTIHTVLSAACARHNTTMLALCGRAKGKRIVNVRRECIRELDSLGFSSVMIGHHMNRDHTTILYHLKMITNIHSPEMPIYLEDIGISAIDLPMDGGEKHGS